MLKRTEVNGNCWTISGVKGSNPLSAIWSGSVEREVFSTSFSSLGAQTLNAPKPFICAAVLEAVYLFCLLLVFTERRNVNQTNGLQTVRGLSGVGVAEAIGIYGVSARYASGVFLSISYNTLKILKSLSTWTEDSATFSEIFQDFSGKSVSKPHLRHDTFNMPGRVNIRQPEKPAAERHSIEAKGVLYDSRKIEEAA